jgi:hypothetical protein
VKTVLSAENIFIPDYRMLPASFAGGRLLVAIIDKTNIGKPTQREAFWVYKLDMFVHCKN